MSKKQSDAHRAVEFMLDHTSGLNKSRQGRFIAVFCSLLRRERRVVRKKMRGELNQTSKEKDPIQPVVVGFMFNSLRNQVALIRKKRPEWQKGLLNGIGGHCEPGESSNPKQTMAREFKEETGLVTSSDDWEHVCVLHRQIGGLARFRCHVYRYMSPWDDLLTVLNSLTDERVEVHWICDLPTLKPLSNLKWLIYMCLDDCKDDPLSYQVHGIIAKPAASVPTRRQPTTGD